VDAPSVAGFYGIFYTLFDKWLWRMQPLRKALGAYNLNGDYTGVLTSSFDKHATKHTASLSITQTWSEINIVLTTTESRSHSLTASLLTEMGWLSYEYLNEPKPGTSETMHCHRGSARFSLDAVHVLEGEYYGGRDRQNCGLLHFERMKIDTQSGTPKSK
jgi:SMODS-associating 2TM, beta-strand rich effector domain